MSDKTNIEWTDATWNPLVGCSRVSAGCVNCYAERHAYRFARQPGTVYEGTARLVNGRPTFTGRVNLNERVLDLPLRWKRPRRIFVNSMSDLFHENVPDETIDRIFAVMALAPHHTFQVLTKRAERMREYCASDATLGRIVAELARLTSGIDGVTNKLQHVDDGMRGFCFANVWLGVSVEDQDAADERIPLLLQTPAAVRFLSCEPLLGPVDLNRIHESGSMEGGGAWDSWESCITGKRFDIWSDGEIDGFPRIDWVIAGGESGPRARPMHPDWAISLRDQCAAASVPFFFKQWGEYLPGSTDIEGTHKTWEPDLEHCALGQAPDYERVTVAFEHGCEFGRVGKHKAGRFLDGNTHSEFPA